jgi:hypothetical protein
MSFNAILDVPILLFTTFMFGFFAFRKNYSSFYIKFTFFYVNYLAFMIYAKVIFNCFS